MSEYQGRELELFERAENWKKYFASFISPYIRGDVLEVGAGIGGTTKVLCNGQQSKWVCLEPDENQISKIRLLILSGRLPSYCKAVNGTLNEYASKELFDVVLYIDVIEHIKDDNAEMLLAVQFLKPGGTLIILAPAHQWLFSPFDLAVGHYRRYSKITLRALTPPSMVVKKLFYLDVAGVMASIVNKLLLKRSYPTQKQIYFWDRFIIATSKKVDFLTKEFCGRALISISEKGSESK